MGKYIVMSDCHRGNGTAADEFAHNSLIYKCALEHYLAEGFTYIELGDAEELWENDAFEQIYITHTSVYDLLRRFHAPDPTRTRYFKIWGNHDEDWRVNPGPLAALFPGIMVHETLTLGPFLFLHGHQVDPICSGTRARISRYFVRNVWSGLQRFGIGDPTPAAENPGRCDNIDQALYRLAKEQNKIVIAGHTHRPVFENLSLTERRWLEDGIATPGVRRKIKAEPVYYNTGSCVHPRCVTGIEITLDAPAQPVFGGMPLSSATDQAAAPFEPGAPAFSPHIALVKWGYQAGAEPAAKGTGSFPATRSLTIGRTVLEERNK
uniref:Calcineurin-like phosphoesterase domain-containing protein n=1 Tax=Desulfatirhabdium butyrativorans TaxID=340467 RepID=A0A7C4RU81_9BACT